MKSVSDSFCRWHGDCAYDLVQSLCGTKTSWAGTDDEDIDVAGYSGQYCVWCLQVSRRRNTHLLAIGLAEVALVGFGPVGVVGGNARHCEESLVLMRGLVGNTGYSASRGEEREGWWRWGMETCLYSNNNNDRTSLQCKLSPTATPSGTPAARSPSHPTFRPSTRVHHFFPRARPNATLKLCLRHAAAGSAVESPAPITAAAVSIGGCLCCSWPLPPLAPRRVETTSDGLPSMIARCTFEFANLKHATSAVRLHPADGSSR